jgi:hypothetical protein
LSACSPSSSSSFLSLALPLLSLNSSFLHARRLVRSAAASEAGPPVPHQPLAVLSTGVHCFHIKSEYLFENSFFWRKWESVRRLGSKARRSEAKELTETDERKGEGEDREMRMQHCRRDRNRETTSSAIAKRVAGGRKPQRYLRVAYERTYCGLRRWKWKEEKGGGGRKELSAGFKERLPRRRR